MYRNVLIAFLTLTGGSLGASDLLALKPTLLSPADGPGVVPALRVKSQAQREWSLDRPDRYSFIEYELASTISTRPKYNDEKSSFDVRGGLAWRFDTVEPPLATFPGTGRSGGMPARTAAPRLRRGSLAAELAAAFEGSESMQDRQWVYGVRINYSPAYDRSPSQWWTPYVWVDYRRVSEIGSGVLAKLGLSSQDYWRWGSQIYWQIALSEVGDGLGRNLKLVPGFQYHKNTDLSKQVGDWADAYRYSVALDWAVPETHNLGQWLSGVRLQYADGRIPPSMTNRTTVSIALTVKWDKLLN